MLRRKGLILRRMGGVDDQRQTPGRPAAGATMNQSTMSPHIIPGRELAELLGMRGEDLYELGHRGAAVQHLGRLRGLIIHRRDWPAWQEAADAECETEAKAAETGAETGDLFAENA
jgi:hypothetical protein